MAGIAALVSAGGYVWALKANVDTLTAEKAVLVSDLTTCKARTTNLTEDAQSDAEIDKIPDAGLGSIPDRWLRPENP